MNWVHPTALLLATLCVAFVQSWFDGFRSWAGVQPDLISALVVYAALNTGLTTTTAVAVVGGLGCDALSSGPFGLGMLPWVGLGILLHLRRDLVLRRSVVAQAILGGMASLGVALAWVFLMVLVWPLASGSDSGMASWPEIREGTVLAPAFGVRLVWQLIVLTAAGAAVTPLVFRVFGWMDAAFSYRPAAGLGHRPDREIKRGRF